MSTATNGAPDLENIVVVGAGQMGTGIAHAFALNGYRVALIDSNPGALEKAVQVLQAIVSAGVKLGKSSEAVGRETLARITTSSLLQSAAAEAGLLIESASEQMSLKLEILRQADAVLPAGAVIATNTSSLSITEMAAATSDPSRVLGMHFFNPVHKMKLVEIVRGLATAQDVVDRATAWSRAIGKSSIVVNESPGFTTSRMSAMLGNEAMFMVESGVATAEDIDTAMRLGLSHPMGPLELGDLTGWDTRLAVLQHLHQTLGEKFRPCPLIVKMVKAGRLGRKVGRGVYEYSHDGEKVLGSGLRAG
jgi:3-hydroxybutyryl-CoA dehydrogenase